MSPQGTAPHETDVEKPTTWTCPKCKKEQVSLISRGCTDTTCKAGAVAPFRKPPTVTPPKPKPPPWDHPDERITMPDATDPANAPMEMPLNQRTPEEITASGGVEFGAPEIGRSATREPNLTPSVTVYRLIEYHGPADWVRDTVSRSLQGSQPFSGDKRITATDIAITPTGPVQELLDKARAAPLSWKGKQQVNATPDPTADRAVQLWVKGVDADFEPLGPRTINTLIAALSFFASEAQPAGGESSMDVAECMDLATALGKGHLG